MCVCLCTYLHTHIHMHICVCMFIHVYKYIHTIMCIFYDYIANFHKISSLEKYPFIISFCASETQAQHSWVLCRDLTGCSVSATPCFPLKVPRKNLLPHSLRLLAGFISLQRYDRGPHFLAPCHSEITLSSQGRPGVLATWPSHNMAACFVKVSRRLSP